MSTLTEKILKLDKAADDLVKKGHKCVQILESLPPIIQYCGNETCTEDNLSIKNPVLITLKDI
jgi:hypothetical protein